MNDFGEQKKRGQKFTQQKTSANVVQFLVEWGIN